MNIFLVLIMMINLFLLEYFFNFINVLCNLNRQNTFPPVVALLKLYHPDGKEAKLSFNPTMTTPLDLKELYQLNNFVQVRFYSNSYFFS